MLLKSRTESDELLAMRSLNTRMILSKKDKLHYSNLEKGYEGEVNFDLLSHHLYDSRHFLNGLLLEVNKSFFQIDTLILSEGIIHLLEIKNFQGDFYLDSDKLFAASNGKEYKNPLNQLQRSATLLRQLLQFLKEDYIVEAYVIFINPEFTLYQAPINQSIIFPTQLNQFLNKLEIPQPALKEKNTRLAEKIVSLHQTKNPFEMFPEYYYDHLQKGVYCKICRAFAIFKNNKRFQCASCGEHETFENALLRSIREFQLLFPDRKLTTQAIYHWCDVELNKRTLSRILNRHYTSLGNTQDTYYE
ncbi:nuclease-related domain-containing protein [Bacillus sp. AK031]